MFANGKLIKKKKSSTSSSLNWGNQETMTFDLPKEETAFMVVLAYRNDTTNLTSSPSSPETPENDLAFSKKDKNVGHFILGKDQWIELKQQPRKQIIKWIKLT